MSTFQCPLLLQHHSRTTMVNRATEKSHDSAVSSFLRLLCWIGHSKHGGNAEQSIGTQTHSREQSKILLLSPYSPASCSCSRDIRTCCFACWQWQSGHTSYTHAHDTGRMLQTTSPWGTEQLRERSDNRAPFLRTADHHHCATGRDKTRHWQQRWRPTPMSELDFKLFYWWSVFISIPPKIVWCNRRWDKHQCAPWQTAQASNIIAIILNF